MIVLPQKTFRSVREELDRLFRIGRAPRVEQDRWQGKDVRNDPAAVSYELRNVVFELPLNGIEDLDHWRQDCTPNLPWADDHFAERVGGEPLNPGVQWAHWPWAKSADRFRGGEQIQFNHTYMERFWPKHARQTPGGRTHLDCLAGKRLAHRGIGWKYGDLQDLVELLAQEPGTRQAWIPLFFPEDTGIGDGGRKPCTLGYQFLVRFGQLHLWYPLRSCDLIRHFNDDCYLAVRLLLWVLDRCRERNPEAWRSIVPGTYAMHLTSLHLFQNDYLQLKGAA